MSYIRGALPFLIYNPNTRDDILPDGVKSSFELSQEVPGGYESNVQVIKRELKSDVLLQGCDLISFTAPSVVDEVSTISCAAAGAAAALSIIEPGNRIKVTGASETSNNDEFLVLSVVYNGTTINLSVQGVLTTEATGAAVTLVRRYVGPWEVLEPEVDYSILPDELGVNKIISFARIPQEGDFIYVTHRGEATYNFVPSEKSVGPAQLSENLRRFQVDIFTADGTTTDFTLTVEGDDKIVNARAIEVSVDGSVKYGDDLALNPPFTDGDFELLPDEQTIRFKTAPTSGAKIHVRNLGFSTVSRRKTLSPTQIGSIAPGEVGTIELANGAVTESKLATNSVSKTKIQAGAVTGAKILLDNNEWLNWKGGIAPGTNVAVLKVDSANLTTIRSPAGPLSINVQDAKVVQVSATAIFDASATDEVDLGKTTNKFKDAHLSGELNAKSAALSETLEVQGDSTFSNITVNGNITVTGTVDSVDLLDLQSQVAALASLVEQNTPAGCIKMWANNTTSAGNLVPPTGWLACDGSSHLKSLYPQLFNAIGNSFGGTPEGSTFNVPDFRGRFPLGKASTGTGSGWGTGSTARAGALDHTHSTPNHTHGLANHIHSIPAHYHGMGSGATLNVTSSGSHTTSIGHTHGQFTTNGGTSHTHGHSFAVDSNTHSHGPTAFNSGETSVSLAHSHSGTALSDGDHSHALSSNDAGTKVTQGTSLRAYSADNQSFYRTRNTGSAGSHTHTLSIDNSGALQHTHSVTVSFTNDGGHGHTLSGSINNESAHTHTVNITQFTGDSSSTGNHIHAANSFSGAIGNVTSGADGNSSFNSGPPSPNVTDQGGASTTDGANPAFQTINFIIKT
jgi:microcystin-dependent protein